MRLLQEEQYISRIYYESMRDNFEGYAWKAEDVEIADGADLSESNAMKRAMLADLKTEFAALDPLQGNNPTLGQLFKIELALVWLVPKTALQARFWTIEDRFRRVVPTSVIASYEASFAPGWIDALPDEVLRQRARNLLDVIHANYLINLARENSIRRLMVIVGASAVLVMLLGTIFISLEAEMAQHGLVAIIAAGMLGAMISILQRLQKATSRDAMVEDGIFELIGLRIGWVSVLSSIGIGGVFALFLYILAAANLLEALLPDFSAPDTPTGTGGSDELATEGKPASDRMGSASDQTANGAVDSGSDASSAEGASDSQPAASGDPAPTGEASLAPQTEREGNNPTGAAICKDSKDACRTWVERVTRSLGMHDTAQFYKMVALAFVSGFAERFVPDIINKLAKQNPAAETGPASLAASPGNAKSDNTAATG